MGSIGSDIRLLVNDCDGYVQNCLRDIVGFQNDTDCLVTRARKQTQKGSGPILLHKSIKGKASLLSDYLQTSTRHNRNRH